MIVAAALVTGDGNDLSRAEEMGLVAGERQIS